VKRSSFSSARQQHRRWKALLPLRVGLPRCHRIPDHTSAQGQMRPQPYGLKPWLKGRKSCRLLTAGGHAPFDAGAPLRADWRLGSYQRPVRVPGAKGGHDEHTSLGTDREFWGRRGCYRRGYRIKASSSCFVLCSSFEFAAVIISTEPTCIYRPPLPRPLPPLCFL
jgi:hypothetical protein